MIKKALIFQIAAVLFCTFAVGCIYAKEVGSLTLKKGVVRIRRNLIDTLHSQAGKKISIQERDEIQAGANTRGVIDITAKGDQIELYPNTFLTIDEISEKSRFSLPVGKVFIKVNKPKLRKKRRNFRLRAANASIGVKGTEFVVGVQGDTTSLLTVSGVVTMANLNAPEVEVEVSKNQATQVVADKKPTPPVEVTPEIKEAIIKSDSAETFQKVEVKEAPTGTSQKKGSSAKTKAAGSSTETESSDVSEPDSSTEVEVPEEEVEVDDIVDDVEDSVEESTVEEETDKSIKITVTEK